MTDAYPASAARSRLPPAWPKAVAEAVSLALVAVSPWLFAGTSAAAEFALAAGVGLLAALWAVHVVYARRLVLRPDLPSACLAGLLLLSAGQLLPLPEVVVGAVSPSTLDWHSSFRPDSAELLPGEPGLAAPRSGWLTLTVDPFQTKRFLARVAALLLVYLVVRNWLAGRDSFRRLAWAATAAGGGIAVLAMAQFFSGPRHVVYWQVPTDGQVFGPFVCKNHYPDYAGGCLGLAIGLALTSRRRSGTPAVPFETPGRVLAAAAAVMIAVSLPFSLSRGGLLAAAVAAVIASAIAVWVRGRVSGRRLLLLAAIGLTAGGLSGWFGWAPVESRLSTLWTTDAGASRVPIWKDALALVNGVPLFGTGSGTFGRVEPLTRTAPIPSHLVFDHAHNEYLEALVEGGTLRLLLTLGLIGGVLRAGFRAAGRTVGRSVMPLAVGGLFGLLMLTVHSVVDFGVHAPAVALLAVTVTAHLVAAADDPGYLPQRVRVAKDGRSTLVVEPLIESDRSVHLTGQTALLAAIGLLVIGTLTTWDAGLRAAADRFRQASERVPEGADRITAATGWVAATPADADAHLALAQAHFDAGRESVTLAGMAVGGGPAALVPGEATGDHRQAGLAAARTARNLSPLTAAAQARLGRYAGGFTTADSARVYFERAKRLAPSDPFVRLATAAEAAKAGDRAAAVADWQEALRRSPRLVRPVLTVARTAGLPADRIAVDLLPNDPVVLLAAADALFPQGDPRRRPFVQAAATGGDGPEQLFAAATAAAELGDPDRASELWQQAVDAADRRSPADGHRARDRFAAWLESEERYEPAAVVLRSLVKADPRNRAYQDRLAAAEHALKLEKEIGGR